MFAKVKIGLALGAGGARGLSHLGVLKALERSNIKISSLAGSSMGALVGAAYAAAGNTAELEQRLMEFINSDEIKNTGFPFISEVFRNKAVSWPHRLETWLKRVYLQARYVAASSVAGQRNLPQDDRLFYSGHKYRGSAHALCGRGHGPENGPDRSFQERPLEGRDLWQLRHTRSGPAPGHERIPDCGRRCPQYGPRSCRSA